MDRNSLVEVIPTVTGQALILRVCGEIDITSSLVARDRLLAAVATLPPPALVVVDLTAVVILSAAGLHLLARLILACTDQGVDIHLVAAPKSLPGRIIGIAGLDKDVSTFDTVELALRPRDHQ
jgi:anti-sigma B factor antagonist